jgi:replicative DNA helicase
MKNFPAFNFTDATLEREMLALILADPTGEALRESRIIRADFSVPHHAALFGVLSEMVLAHKRIDPLLVGKELGERGLLDAFEGMSGLWELIDEVGAESAAYRAGVADKLKELARKDFIRKATVDLYARLDGHETAEQLAHQYILSLTNIFQRDSGAAWVNGLSRQGATDGPPGWPHTP